MNQLLLFNCGSWSRSPCRMVSLSNYFVIQTQLAKSTLWYSQIHVTSYVIKWIIEYNINHNTNYKTFNEKFLSRIKQAASDDYNGRSAVPGLNILCFRQLDQLYSINQNKCKITKMLVELSLRNISKSLLKLKSILKCVHKIFVRNSDDLLQ